MKNWNELSITDKNDIIKVAVQNGITTLHEIRERYNEFAEGGPEEVLERVNSSSADFVQRLKDPNRTTIQDWSNPNYVATHKLSVGTDEQGNNYIYPEVQNIDGKLVDFTRPPYAPWIGMAAAEERGDTVRVNNLDDAIRFTETYKQYYPSFNYSSGGKIHIKKKNRGKFTALKERTGHSASWFKAHGTPAQKKMATFALNARKWKHGDGGNLFYDGGPQESDNTRVQLGIVPNLPMDNSAESKFYRDLAMLSAMTDEEKRAEEFYNRAHDTGTVAPTDAQARRGWMEVNPISGEAEYHAPTTVSAAPLTEGQRMWQSPAFQLALAPMFDAPFMLSNAGKVAKTAQAATKAKRAYSAPTVNIMPVEDGIPTNDIPVITAENAANITPEQWTAAQDAAIARGNMTEAQRLRDLHFKVSAPNSYISKGVYLPSGKQPTLSQADYYNGNTDLVTLYHSSVDADNLIKEGFDGIEHGLGRTKGEPEGTIFASTNQDYAADYSNLYVQDGLSTPDKVGLMELKVPRGAGVYEGNEVRLRPEHIKEITKSAYEKTPWLRWLKTRKTDNSLYNIKSADAVTYGDDGVRIPLGKRDNFKLNDIRWGLLPWILGGGAGTVGYNYSNQDEGPLVEMAMGGHLFDNGGQYTVNRGDSLWKIAHDNNIPLSRLRELNPQVKGNMIHPGDVLRLSPEFERQIVNLREERQREEVANMDNFTAIQAAPHDSNYVVIDKPNKKLQVYDRDNNLVYESNGVSFGKSGDDYNTITYVNANGSIRNNAGNNSTPAGISVITGVGSYHGLPSFTRGRINDDGTVENIASSIHYGNTEKKNISNGCVRANSDTLKELSKYVGEGTAVYTLPEQKGSKFSVKNNKLNYTADNPFGMSEGPQRYWDDYNVRKDKSYSPLAIVYNGDNYDDEYNANVLSYTNALSINKEALQKRFNLSSDEYNRLAELAVGIAEQESKFGTSLRYKAKQQVPDEVIALAKNFKDSDSTNMFYAAGEALSKTIKGSTTPARSRGLTQIKIGGDNKEMQGIYNELGINENTINNPYTSALATLSRLAYMYNSEVKGRNFKGAGNAEVSPYDALLYKYMGRGSELKNKTATPDKNKYISNVKKYASDFDFLEERLVEKR